MRTNDRTPRPPRAACPLPVSADELRQFRDAALAADHEIVYLDLSGCTDKASLLEAASRAFRFPDWFGRNWDALSDSLADLSWLDAPGYLVVIEHAGTLRSMEGQLWGTLCEVFADVASERSTHGVAWRVVEVRPAR